jgi:DtxR family Mn-dependent transcriptional regulator
MTPTSTEENYLKAIYKLSIKKPEPGASVSTNELSHRLQTTPASVTDMIKRLNEKGLIEYKPYHGVSLTQLGQSIALQTLRKNRLWEVFLVEKLKFSWDEVNETAEELEHINSPKLFARLDEFLGFPKFDPHGDPIPDENGNMDVRQTSLLSSVSPGKRVKVASVIMNTPDFLRYLDRLKLHIDTELTVIEHIPFDNSCLVELNGKQMIISSAVTQNLMVSAAQEQHRAQAS